MFNFTGTNVRISSVNNIQMCLEPVTRCFMIVFFCDIIIYRYIYIFYNIKFLMQYNNFLIIIK